MHKRLFYDEFISCLYMFRANVLIIRRSKLHYTASGIITSIGDRLVHEMMSTCARNMYTHEINLLWNKFCSSSWLITEINSNITFRRNNKNKVCVSTYIYTYLLTYSMVQSPSWEGNWFAASQEIPRILWNPKVHYLTHKRPPPVPILGQPNPVHTHTHTHTHTHIYIYIFIYIYTGCFTTLGHKCRRWFPRSLWSKKFI